MTEDQIERQVERLIDRLDREFLAGVFTQEEYDERIRNIDAWAKDQYRFAKMGG